MLLKFNQSNSLPEPPSSFLLFILGMHMCMLQCHEEISMWLSHWPLTFYFRTEILMVTPENRPGPSQGKSSFYVMSVWAAWYSKLVRYANPAAHLQNRWLKATACHVSMSLPKLLENNFAVPRLWNKNPWVLVSGMLLISLTTRNRLRNSIDVFTKLPRAQPDHFPSLQEAHNQHYRRKRQ